MTSCIMGKCWNTPGSFECCTTTTHNFNETTGECTLKDPCSSLVCTSGYECEVTNALLREAECVDINECNQEEPVCSMDEQCENTDGSYECSQMQAPTQAMAPTTEEATTTVPATTSTTTTTTTTTTTKKKSKCRGRPRRNKRESG